MCVVVCLCVTSLQWFICASLLHLLPFVPWIPSRSHTFFFTIYLFPARLPSFSLSLSLCRNCSDVKCHWTCTYQKYPTQSEHLSLSHSLLYLYPGFLTLRIQAHAFTAAPLPFFSFSLLFMPFFGFIATHFATSPPQLFLLHSCPRTPSIISLARVWVRPALTHKPKHSLPHRTPPLSSLVGHSPAASK